MDDERLTYLLEAYLEGRLTPTEKAELEDSLRQSAAARRQFWQHTSLHGLSYAATKQLWSQQPSAAASLTELPFAEVPVGAAVATRRAGQGTTWQMMSWLRDRRLASALAAACVVVGAVWFFCFRESGSRNLEAHAPRQVVSPASSNGVAVVKRAAGVQWADAKFALESGTPLTPGWLRLKAGAMQIEFYGGARVILEGPSEFAILSKNEAYLKSGRLSAQVPEQAHGFKVKTDGLVVTDLGTEFGLVHTNANDAEVHVFTGRVQLVRAGTDLELRELAGGAGARVSGKTLRDIRADRSLFLSEDELASREQAELRARYDRWKLAAEELSNDPATLVHFTFEDQRPSDREVKNRAATHGPQTDGSIIGCDWTAGRWPGKGALEYKLASDRIRLVIPGRYQSLTYLAWVRVDSLPNEYNALALTESHKTGEAHWQLRDGGELYLSVRWGSPDEGDRGWEASWSPPVITPDRYGHWFMVASVYDGEAARIRHFVNGQFVFEKPIEHPTDLTLDAVEIGNWGARGDRPEWASTQRARGEQYMVRNLVGRLDEIAILSRPLGPQEIHRLFELGRPGTCAPPVVADVGKTHFLSGR